MPVVQTIKPRFGRHTVSRTKADAFRRKNGAEARAEQKAAKSYEQPVQNPVRTDADSPVRTESNAEVYTPVRIDPITRTTEKPKVAYYARISSILENQRLSIETQQEHFEHLIRSNPDFIFAGSYVDICSGTKAETRPELQRLLQDCRDHKISIVMTKSISRFCRNVTDLLEIVRELKALNVAVWFEKENLHTDRMESEFMLTLLARFAEDESHSISGNCKWSIRNRFRDGTYRQTIAPYGYDFEGSILVPVPEEAEIVKRIYGMVLSGFGMVSIAKTLNEEGIPGPTGRKWVQGSLMAIVKNPVYTGAVLFQKTFKDESFIQRKNNGELDQFYDGCHHEPIISREDFDNAQRAVEQRAKEVGYRDGNRKRSTIRYCFSGILKCKICGTVLHRQVWNGDRPCWICNRHSTHPDLCSMKPQSDADLKRAFVNCLNKLNWSQKTGHGILDLYERNLGKTETEKNAERLMEIERLLEENRRKTRKLNAMIMREHFLPEHREKKFFLTNQSRELLREKNKILIGGEPTGTLQQLRVFVNNWKITGNEESFPEEMFTEFVEDCTVDSGKTVEFRFRCGLKVTESLYKVDLPAT